MVRSQYYGVRLFRPWRQIVTILVILMVVFAAAPLSSIAAPQPHNMVSLPFSTSNEHDGVQFTAQGSLQLRADAPVAPIESEHYERYGYYLSPVAPLDTPTARFNLTYQSDAPAGSAVQLDLRGSTDGNRWTAWETDIVPAQPVTLSRVVRFIQYRVRLFGSANSRPTLHDVTIQPLDSPARYQALSSSDAPVAPTFTLRATRQGMVGGRTANGHIITPRDRFVSLPSWSALSTRNGNEYQVRITYRGRSEIATVKDVGPWNSRDNYWDTQIERHFNLPQGWPQDHAAYYQGHNGGVAAKGYVRFPTAIDVGDGVWWDLGIAGDQGEVEVTFLWLGRDPLASPVEQEPQGNTVLVSESKHYGQAFQSTAAIRWYHTIGGCGEGQHAQWTKTTTSAAQQENTARWQPDLPTAGRYKVYAHVPICFTPREDAPATTAARYTITHRDGSETVVVNQAQETAWVLLGEFSFAAGEEGFVALNDVAGDAGRVIWFDDVRWELVAEAEETAEAETEETVSGDMEPGVLPTTVSATTPMTSVTSASTPTPVTTPKVMTIPSSPAHALSPTETPTPDSSTPDGDDSSAGEAGFAGGD